MPYFWAFAHARDCSANGNKFFCYSARWMRLVMEGCLSRSLIAHVRRQVTPWLLLFCEGGLGAK